jgi:hypothetical protein
MAAEPASEEPPASPGQPEQGCVRPLALPGRGCDRASLSPPPPRRAHAKLFLGGLSWETTEGAACGLAQPRSASLLGQAHGMPQQPAPAPTLPADKLTQHFAKYGEIAEVVSDRTAPQRP